MTPPASSPLPKTLFCSECGTMTVNNETRVMPCEAHTKALKAHAPLRELVGELIEALELERDRLFKHFQHEQREVFVKGQAMDLWPEIKRMDAVLAKAKKHMGAK